MLLSESISTSSLRKPRWCKFTLCKSDQKIFLVNKMKSLPDFGPSKFTLFFFLRFLNTTSIIQLIIKKRHVSHWDIKTDISLQSSF